MKDPQNKINKAIEEAINFDFATRDEVLEAFKE